MNKVKQSRAWMGAVMALALIVSSAPAAPPGPVHLRIIAINDLHGNLEPQAGGIQVDDPAHPGKRFSLDAGGVERMATLVKRLRAGQKNSIFVAGGDLVGASPPLSGMFHDEPVIEALSAMGLSVSSVGNHEFDKGLAELLRQQNGGCHPVDGCKGGHVFKGAKFQYLAASTFHAGTDKTILPPYVIKRFEGVPVAFIGLTRQGTPTIISPSAAQGLDFRDEAATVNALVPKLKARGVQAIVVLIHLGGTVSGMTAQRGNGCENLKGGIIDAVNKFDKAVDVIVSADSHYPYICTIDGRLVTQAYRYSTMVTEIDLDLDRHSHDVVSAKAQNFVVDPNLPPDPAIAKLLDNYRRRVGPLLSKVIATLPAPLSEDKTVNGESPLGDLITDAELAASDHAQIATINQGGIRISIERAGPVTYSDLYSVLPFANFLVTQDMTGAQLKTMLEQQWVDPNIDRKLQFSAGFHYEWDGRKPYGEHVVPGSMTLNGTPIRPEATYRVALPDFVANGGDGLVAATQGTNRASGGTVLDALVAWLPGHVPPNGEAAGRFKRVDAPQ